MNVLINNIMVKKYHIIYKTTNLATGKYYIGKHSTDNLNDNYLGSGILLSRAIKKYGKDNFVKEILYVFNTQSEMELKEKEIVNETLINSDLTYNIALGGQGGNLGELVNKKISINTSIALRGKPKSESHKKALRESEFAKNYKPSSDTKSKISKTLLKTWSNMTEEERKQKCGFPGEKNGFYGKTHSQETLIKIKETIGDSRKGANNPRAKSIEINGVIYSTRKECMESLGMNKKQFYKFLGENK